MNSIQLNALPTSSVARNALVTRIDLEGFAAARLKAMGFFEGQTVELSRQGNPLLVKAAGCTVALAEEIAARIMVAPIEQ